MAGVVGYVSHTFLEQAAAPNSSIAELKLAIGGVTEVSFASEAALDNPQSQPMGPGGDAARTAISRIEDVKLI